MRVIVVERCHEEVTLGSNSAIVVRPGSGGRSRFHRPFNAEIPFPFPSMFSSNISPDNQGHSPTSDDPPLPSSTPTLPDLPLPDTSLELESILGPVPASQPPHSIDSLPRPVEDCRHLVKIQKRANQVHKRQSNVLKLSEENDKLKEELRAMTERLEAAERRRQELESREKRQSRG